MFGINPIKIIVADSHKLIKEGLILLLAQLPNLIVIDEAEDGAELISKCKRYPPDLILIDSQLNEPDTFTTVKNIRSYNPTSKIIVLMQLNEYPQTSITKRKVVNGIVSKCICPSELLFAIQKVMAGEFYLGNFYQNGSDLEEELVEEKDKLVSITKRENEILYYLAKGLTTKEIADKLFLSCRTIDSHRSKIIQKYNLRSTAALLNFAHEVIKSNGNGKK